MDPAPTVAEAMTEARAALKAAWDGIVRVEAAVEMLAAAGVTNDRDGTPYTLPCLEGTIYEVNNVLVCVHRKLHDLEEEAGEPAASR